MSSKISVQVAICLKNLQSIISDLSGDSNQPGPSSQIWHDILARFRIWSSNIGAHQTGQASLDYRLRDASHIRDQILKVLASLRQSFLDVEEILAEAAQDGENKNPAPELEEVYSSIHRLLECLFQLSMRIRRPALRDRILGRRKDDSKDFEDFDRRHVKDKFPYASDVLVDRLTMAVSKRRSTLKYFERHHKKLGKGIKVADYGGGNEAGTFYSSTVATTFHEPSMDTMEKASVSHASETSYTPSLFSGDSRITIPAAPLESADRRPFECPFCYVIITVSNLRDWAKHVFQDLEPYVCVVEDCNLPERLYKSRHEWMSHLRGCHQRFLDTPQCPLCMETPLTNLQLQQHLRRHLEDLALFILPAQHIDTGPQTPDLENIDSDSSQGGSNSVILFDKSENHSPESRPDHLAAESSRSLPRLEGGNAEQESGSLSIKDEDDNVINTLNASNMTKEDKAHAIVTARYRLKKDRNVQNTTQKDELYTKNEGEEIEDEVEVALGQPQKTLRGRFDRWRRFVRKKDDKGESGGPSKKKKGPAHAYKFSNTIIVEDEDGEVIKKYTAPDRDAAGTNMLGSGRRLSKEEFLKQIQQLDPERRNREIEESDAPEAIKTWSRLSRQQPDRATANDSFETLEAVSEEDEGIDVPTLDVQSSLLRHHQGQTAAELRRQRLAAIRSTEEEDEISGETAAEKRRRLVALGIVDHDVMSSSESDYEEPQSDQVAVPQSERGGSPTQPRTRIQWGGESGREKPEELKHRSKRSIFRNRGLTSEP